MAKISENKIFAALAARDARFAASLEKGSTGEYGKRYESDERISYKIRMGQNLYRDDFKAKKSNQVDMFVFVAGHKRRVEIKTGFGALVYDDDAERAWAKLEKLKNSSEILVWDLWKDGCPLCFILGDFLKALEEYNEKGLNTWFSFKPAAKTNMRGGQLQFQQVKTSKKKMAFLDGIAFEIGLDWDTIKETGELE